MASPTFLSDYLVAVYQEVTILLSLTLMERVLIRKCFMQYLIFKNYYRFFLQFRMETRHKMLKVLACFIDQNSTHFLGEICLSEHDIHILYIHLRVKCKLRFSVTLSWQTCANI